MTREELDKVLENHKHWLREDVEGWQNMGADLQRANLQRADLRGANLQRANLRGANLRGADLREVDLWGAGLREANLRGADLWGADLRGADLWGAGLWGADLRGANLREANLQRADLREANLRGADLRGAKNVPFVPMTCPDTGAFVAWKKCNTSGGLVIVKLLIPEDAKRSSGTGRKCRTDKAVVLEIQDMAGEALEGVVAISSHDPLFTYEVGKTVEPIKPFDDCRWNECASGIHFFINRQEAVNY